MEMNNSIVKIGGDKTYQLLFSHGYERRTFGLSDRC